MYWSDEEVFEPYYWLTWSGLHLMPGKTNKTFYTLLPLTHEYLVEYYYCAAMNELNWFPADTEVSFYLLQCYCFKQYTLTKHQWSRVYNPGFYCWSSAANCLNLCKYWNVKQSEFTTVAGLSMITSSLQTVFAHFYCLIWSSKQ